MIHGLSEFSKEIELIAVDDQLKAFHKGKLIDFSELPSEIIDILTDLMIADKQAMKVLITFKKVVSDMLKQYCWCNFGGINHEADIIDEVVNPEYWDCGKRASCPYEGKICSKKIFGKRELEFAKFLSTGLLDKEIADRMGITYSTACDYRVRIQQKTGTTNKVELVNYLHHENIIN